jgi:1-acyl-sn-glycerol-3-phosphate acyltransferase
VRRPTGVPLSFWYHTAATILRPTLMTVTKRDWRGGEQLPRTGGVVVAVNHVSWADPLTFAHFLWDHGRAPRYLAKSAVFRIPVIGKIVAACGQIPVYRESANAADAFARAVAAVEAGECVVVYPEGTLTRDPDLWPMVGKTGAARIALTTGCPVIPVAQWGPQDLLAPYAKKPHLLPRATIHVSAGPPVHLTDLRQGPLTAEKLRIATDRIMDAITEELEKLRGEKAPIQRFDPRTARRARTGHVPEQNVDGG